MRVSAVLFSLLIPAMLAAVPTARAEPPATRPTAAAVWPIQRVSRLVAQLADGDATKRQNARTTLMELPRSELPTLRQALKDARPLQPSQQAVLRDIFTHIYLAGDDYTPEEDGSGFLGVRLPSWSRPDERALLSIERGVVVVSRIPGFCAFKMLQDGDVILSLGGAEGEFTSPEQLIDSVRSFKGGQTIVFSVLRQGQIIKVPITLDRKPTGLNGLSIEEFLSNRAERASEVWEKEFAPLLEDKVG